MQRLSLFRYTSIMLNAMGSSEMNTVDSFKVDRAAFSVASFSEESDEWVNI